jgi:NAD(P)-dependent dehydrogenase (short-subunit alcohol dehydrogenase family)
MDLGLRGSRAPITGGSRGIGFAVADVTMQPQSAPRASLDRLPGDQRRLAAGQQPAACRGDQRQPD